MGGGGGGGGVEVRISQTKTAVCFCLQTLMERPDFVESLRSFAAEKKVDAVVVMTVSVGTGDVVARQLGIFSPSRVYRQQVSATGHGNVGQRSGSFISVRVNAVGHFRSMLLLNGSGGWVQSFS